MKYMIIGAGGTGGVLGFHMTAAGKDVTLIARGEHLKAMQEKGLTLVRQWCHTRQTIRVNAVDMDSCSVTPDVILVCVKGYSLDSVIPFLKKAAGPETIIIPILNIFGTGIRIQEQIPDRTVLDGCIYVSANIKEPGVLTQHGEILRVVFGVRDGEKVPAEQEARLPEIERDLKESGIDGLLSEHIRTACLKKFSYVSPVGAAGLFYDAKAKDFQQEGPQREMVKAMMREITDLAEAMGYGFDDDYVRINLDILSKLDPGADTSLQRDVAAGRPSEIDGLVYEVVRMGEKYGVPMPAYSTAAELLKKRYGGEA